MYYFKYDVESKFEFSKNYTTYLGKVSEREKGMGEPKQFGLGLGKYAFGNFGGHPIALINLNLLFKFEG